jgi:AcrR family transcriptional regulator
MSREPTSSAREVRRRGAPVVDRVLAAVLDELARQGFHRLSVPDVAELAGVHKTSVYRRWPTKGALVAAALSRALGDRASLPDTGSLHGDLVAFTTRAVSWVSSPVGRGVTRALLADADDPDLRSVAEAMMARGSRGPRALFRRARARGELEAGADVSMALTVVAGALLQRLFVENAPAPRAFVERLVSFVLAGIGASQQAQDAARP